MLVTIPPWRTLEFCNTKKVIIVDTYDVVSISSKDHRLDLQSRGGNDLTIRVCGRYHRGHYVNCHGEFEASK
jgi:hypothetical protein